MPPTSTARGSRPRVTVLTGPSGAGKTTVATLLAHDAERPTVDLRTDTFYAAIATGGLEPYLPEADTQNRTVVEAIVAAVDAYARGGYDVVVDGVVGPTFLVPFVDAARRGGWDLAYVVLRPDLGTTLARGTAREATELRDPVPLTSIHGYFAGLADTGLDDPALRDLEAHAVDTTAHSARQTADLVRRGLDEGRFRLGAAAGRASGGPVGGLPAAPDRTDPPLRVDEVATLRAFLDYHRDTLRLKTAGLDAAGLARALPPGAMTLGGLLKHLALVESDWLAKKFDGDPMLPPFDTADWAADPDWEWHSAADDSPAELRTLFDAAVADSDRRIDAALARGAGLEQVSAVESRQEGEGAFSLRWILVHLIEEYARHNGHADLLREAVDGATGE